MGSFLSASNSRERGSSQPSRDPSWCPDGGALPSPTPDRAFSLAANDVITSRVDHPLLIPSANCLAYFYMEIKCFTPRDTGVTLRGALTLNISKNDSSSGAKMAITGLDVLPPPVLFGGKSRPEDPTIMGMEALRLPEVTARRLRSREAANGAPLPAQVHLGRWQQDQDGGVRPGAGPAARQRLLRAGVQRPRVRGAVGSVGFKLLRWARGCKEPTAHPSPKSALCLLLPAVCGTQESAFLDPLVPSVALAGRATTAFIRKI